MIWIISQQNSINQHFYSIFYSMNYYFNKLLFKSSQLFNIYQVSEIIDEQAINND